MSDGLAPQDEGGDDHIKKLVKEVVEEAQQEGSSPPTTIDNAGEQVEGSWQQVYHTAMSRVGQEIEEYLLDGFLQNQPDGDGTGETSRYIDTHLFIDYLITRGLSPLTDPRVKEFMKAIRIKKEAKYSHGNIKQFIDQTEFKALVKDNDVLLGAIKGSLVVENFPNLVTEVEEIFEACASDNFGKVTTYIPGLAVNPDNKWAASICTIDGQMHGCGDVEESVTLQSVTKALFYGINLDTLGADAVHARVGKEASGHGFNKITLSERASHRVPHNPLINTGAITLASMFKQDLPMSERFDFALSKYKALAAGSGDTINFNNSVYLSEKDNSNRNYAIGHYLKDKGCLEPKCNLTDTLELYFQLCSIEANTKTLSVIAGALANGGRNVFTGEQVIKEASVQNLLSIMYSSGMYDFSGEWAFEIGLPAKSGVSGLIIVVIPDTMGIALWSPPLDSYGNSVRGLKFTRELVKRYTTTTQQNMLHPFSNKRCGMDKIDMDRGTISLTNNKSPFSAGRGGPIVPNRGYHTVSHPGPGISYNRTAVNIAGLMGKGLRLLKKL